MESKTIGEMYDEAQHKEPASIITCVIAKKLSEILTNWDKLSKEQVHQEITKIHDELLRDPKEIVDEAQYEEAEWAVKNGAERAKTKVAYFKLSGCGGVGVDAHQAVVLLEERVKDHDYEAMWLLGLCCEYGMGTEQNVERAEDLYRYSCEGGNTVGEFLLMNDGGGRGTGLMRVHGL